MQHVERPSKRAPSEPVSVRVRNSEGGFSLMEAIVAMVISVIAILGLAHTFGLGRGFIDQFEVGRLALARAQARMEALGALRSSEADLSWGIHPSSPDPFLFGNPSRVIGTEIWRVGPFPDPNTGNAQALRRVTVIVTWGQGVNQDSVVLNRLFPI